MEHGTGLQDQQTRRALTASLRQLSFLSLCLLLVCVLRVVLALPRTRPRSLRRKTIICCRSAAFSASSANLDRNGASRRANSKWTSANIAVDASQNRH